jgi:Domain of unknown function (DUF5004)
MKKITCLLALAALLYLSGCRPAAINDYQDYSASSVTALGGNWKLTKATQTDEDAKRKGFPYKTLDISTALNLNAVRLTLNANNGAPSTAIVNYGTAPSIFKITNGNWLLDNKDKPSQLWLANATDTTKFILGDYNKLSNNILSLKQKKFLGNVEMITYEYEFSRN